MCDGRRAVAEARCGCSPRVEDRRLHIDATNCPDGGRLPKGSCCETAVAALVGRPVVAVWTRIGGGTYVQDDYTVGLLVAAGRFAALVATHDERLARRARRDPLGAAREAVGTQRRELNPLTSSSPTRAMLHDVAAAGELPPEELRLRYDERLRSVVEARGVERVAAETDTTTETVSALAEGDSPTLTLEDAAAILALGDDEPDTEAIVLETRDALLLGMTTAVLDVEAVESGIDGALDAREIQQKIEGRLPMTLDELATIHGYIESRKP